MSNLQPTCTVGYGGRQEWWVNDKRHREDGPAITRQSGDQEWWLNGELHRADGPAKSQLTGHNTGTSMVSCIAIMTIQRLFKWMVRKCGTSTESYIVWMVQHASRQMDLKNGTSTGLLITGTVQQLLVQMVRKSGGSTMY